MLDMGFYATSTSSARLKELLRVLCCGTLWKYAVFWRLNSGTHDVLTWEDGYVDNTRSDICTDIDAILCNQSSHWYLLGQGSIGEVALTGQHLWIFANEDLSSLLFNGADDLQLQFSAGIQTILLVPITNCGVVQLSSLYTLLEDTTLVTWIKDLFYGFNDQIMGMDTFSLSYPDLISPINSPELLHIGPSPLDMSNFGNPIIEPNLPDLPFYPTNGMDEISTKFDRVTECEDFYTESIFQDDKNLIISNLESELHEALGINSLEKDSSFVFETNINTTAARPESTEPKNSLDFSLDFPNSYLVETQIEGIVRSTLEDSPPASLNPTKSIPSIDKNGKFVSNLSNRISKRRERRNGGAPKQRPRDRQLIQDRIMELRELIPNGSKCSIDGLLDRTVKHMLFLQSVSEQSKKLDSQSNGATWAYQMEAKPEISPLIVKNLDQPDHILIEMICKEYGLFLEIAQIIKGLQLNILRGVLESRSDKLCAHFIIEASKGFDRMDILWPLMQLLQRNN